MKQSDIIKLELMKYFRFERGFEMVCTECINNSDISAIKEKCLVEVEVKISKSDFRREFQDSESTHWKERKHYFYKHIDSAWASYIIPNRFYFCVPAELTAWALEFLKDKNSKYGLLAYDKERMTGNTHIVTIKGAKSLHTQAPEKSAFHQIRIRTVSELITLKQKYIADRQELEALKAGIITEGIE